MKKESASEIKKQRDSLQFAMQRIANAEVDWLDGARDSAVLNKAINIAKSAIAKSTIAKATGE
jgi:hypothetical protein